MSCFRTPSTVALSTRAVRLTLWPRRISASSATRNFAVATALVPKRSLSSVTKFDTKKFVQSLEKGGFSPNQAETAVGIVNKALNDGISLVAKNLVTKE